MDPFEVLGVPRDATFLCIKSQYRHLLRRYHPSVRQEHGTPKALLDERFLAIQHAWTQLSQPESRRRCLELLQLLDEQEAMRAGMAALIEEAGSKGEAAISSNNGADGNTSSDGDEDTLPSIGLRRRKTLMEHTLGLKREQSLRNRLNQLTGEIHIEALYRCLKTGPSKTTRKALQKEDINAERRRKLAKLRRSEYEAFSAYRDAVVRKFEAELEAEARREEFEHARADREQFERAPRNVAGLMRQYQHVISTLRALVPQTSLKRNTSILSHAKQILSTEDLDDPAVSASHKPLNSRGWSSDVTGDQDSSDDDSSDGRASGQYVSNLWHPSSRLLQPLDRVFAEPRRSIGVVNRGETSSQVAISQEQARRPFRMIVKRPTGFSENVDLNDASTESAQDSGPPSPQPFPESSLHKFTLAQPTLLARFLGVGVNTGLQFSSTEQNIKNKNISRALDRNDILIKQVSKTRLFQISTKDVHLLGLEEKIRVLGLPVDAEASPADLMRRLAQLDPTIAQRFMIKPDIKEDFNFRLINERSADHCETFIALSYRRRIQVSKSKGHFTLPLEPELFQAVLDERQSEHEGVWVDQICIDQDSQRERAISMSAMDMVYRSARLAVVVLDDIEIDAGEVDILLKHMKEYTELSHVTPSKRFRGKQPPYLSTHESLCEIVRKLLRSSWFRRAWCRHEMRLAREHVFLVPFIDTIRPTKRSTLRFTGQWIKHVLDLATEVPLESAVELVKPALHAFFRNRYQHVDGERIHHGNFTTVIAEVFAMEAGGDPRISELQRAADALKDKTAIVLNTMECGIALSSQMRAPHVSLTKSECHYMLLTLALAARDPGALCSVGPPMQFATLNPISPAAATTWLFEPTNVDAGLNTYRTLNRIMPTASISTNVSQGEHFVTLDLQIFEKTRQAMDSDQIDLLSLARRMIGEGTKRKCGRNRARYLLQDTTATHRFGSMWDVYATTLTCVLECGPDWMEQVCQRYSVSRWKQDLLGACELLIALKNTDFRWPENAWSDSALGFIMDFVNFIIVRALPQRQIIHFEPWRPICVETTNGGKVVTFVSSKSSARTAVPSALSEPDYVHLARLWVLEPRQTWIPQVRGDHLDGATTSDWTLLGKSVIFSDDRATEDLRSAGTRLPQQNVFGREDAQLQRLIRERSFPF